MKRYAFLLVCVAATLTAADEAKNPGTGPLPQASEARPGKTLYSPTPSVDVHAEMVKQKRQTPQRVAPSISEGKPHAADPHR